MEGSRSPLHRLRALNCTSGPYSYTKGPPRYSLLSLDGNRTDINICRYVRRKNEKWGLFGRNARTNMLL